MVLASPPAALKVTTFPESVTVPAIATPLMPSVSATVASRPRRKVRAGFRTRNDLIPILSLDDMREPRPLASGIRRWPLRPRRRRHPPDQQPMDANRGVSIPLLAAARQTAPFGRKMR